MARPDVVIPSAGRPSLRTLLAALAPQKSAFGRIVVVDDGGSGVEDFVPGDLDVTVLAGARRGPAAARNAGWRACDADWIAFLDDDVVPGPDWASALLADLDAAGPGVGGSQGAIRVPLPEDRPPTDWERNVAGLEDAQWATADLAYREDADLGLRVVAAGWSIERGARHVVHPVGPAGAAVSVRKQAGNADDAAMDALHGPGWRQRAGAPPGRRRRHLAVATAGLAALLGRPRTLRRAGLALYLAGTAELAWARIAPGPRTPREVATMLWTSALLPFAASGWWLLGRRRARGLRPRPAAVLFDRDGTLVVDVPYNGDPARVELVPGAREAVERVRRAGILTGVVSNQSGIARGMLTRAQVDAVNARVEELLGAPLGPWAYCPHGPGDGCACRKPAPGLVHEVAGRLGVDPARCAVIGDIGADVDAARAAGARGILVPTPQTRREEVEAAPEVAPDLGAAVGLLLGAEAAR